MEPQSPAEPRLDFQEEAPGALQAMLGLEEQLQSTDLEPALLDLMKTRASQINGCAFCIDLHTTEARARGESEKRLYALNAWQEFPLYTERERAALAWTESITCIADTHAPDEVYEEVRRHFTGEELANLTLAIVAINGWNRLAISFRAEPESIQPETA